MIIDSVTPPHTAIHHELPLVECHGATLTVGRAPAEVTAVCGVTASLYRGDRIALIGPSGSGKSSLLHLLSGLEVATSGTVAWPALLGDQSPRLTAAVPGVAMVFQGPSLIPSLDVLENVLLPLQLAGLTAPNARARADDALAVLGLTDLATRLPDDLSGGQAQRVSVARALAARPQLILADEPTGQLDAAAGGHVVDALLDAADHTGAGLLVTTHDQRVASRLRTRWAMQDGKLQGSSLTGAGVAS